MNYDQQQASTRNTNDDYYALLGLEFGAHPDDIVSAYRRLARQYHPDKNVSVSSASEREEIQERFRKIKVAYEVLSDANKRYVYNNYGLEGLKYVNHSLVRRQIPIEELNTEFRKLQSQIIDNKINEYAHPWASFTVGLDVSELFKKKTDIKPLKIDAVDPTTILAQIANDNDSSMSEDNARVDETSGILEQGQEMKPFRGEIEISDEDEDDFDSDDDGESYTLVDCLPEINMMSTNIRVQSEIASDHNMILSGNLNVRNGTGDGSFTTSYHYQYSKKTRFISEVLFGTRPCLSLGFKRQMSPKTLLETRALIILHPYGVLFSGPEVSITQVLRDNLRGTISYKEGLVNSSLKTALIYLNERLASEFTLSYKLELRSQDACLGVEYKASKNTRFSLELRASSDEGVSVSYGCQTVVLDINVIGATMAFSVPSGITLNLRYVRARQEFNLPIYLSDDVTSGPLFYGTIAPLAAYFIIERCYIRFVKPKELFPA